MVRIYHSRLFFSCIFQGGLNKVPKLKINLGERVDANGGKKHHHKHHKKHKKKKRRHYDDSDEEDDDVQEVSEDDSDEDYQGWPS